MKTFLALAVLSLATSVTSFASSSTSTIHRPKFTEVTTGESGLTRLQPRPRLAPIADEGTIAGSVASSDLTLKPRPRFTAIEVPSNRQLPRPKFRDSEGVRKPRFSPSEVIAAQSRPKPRDIAV